MAIELEFPYFIAGLLTFSGLVVAIVLCLKIISKYFQYKQRVFLFVGLTAILISEPWWPAAIGWLVIVITKQNLNLYTYLILGVVLLPVLALVWLTAFTDLMYKEKQKKILIIFAIYGILFEIVFFTLLSIDPLLIGDLSAYFDPDYGIFVRAYEFSLLAFLGLTGFLFARESFKSDNPEIRLKGKFFLAAIITFLIGGITDIYAQFDFPRPSSVILTLIARSLLILTTFEFYCSLILPRFVKQIFLRKKQS